MLDTLKNGKWYSFVKVLSQPYNELILFLINDVCINKLCAGVRLLFLDKQGFVTFCLKLKHDFIFFKINKQRKMCEIMCESVSLSSRDCGL